MCGCAYGTTYYVGAGEAQTTIANVNALSLVAGDSVLFKRGETFNDERLNITSGNSSAYITYGAYGVGAKPLFDVPNTFTLGGIYAYEDSYFIIDNLQFSGGMAGNMLLWIQDCYEAKVTNCDFTGIVPDYAIRIFHGSATQSCYDILIDSCAFTSTGTADAIRLYAGSLQQIHDITISNCVFNSIVYNAIRIFVTQAAFDAGVMPYNIIINSNVMNTIGMCAVITDSGDNIIITNNVCSEIGSVTTPAVNAFQLGNLKNSIVEGNSITNVYTSAPDGIGIILDWGFTNDNYLTENTIVKNNIITGCLANTSVAGINNYKAKNCQIYNNIVYNCGRGIEATGSVCSGVQIYNNTLTDIQTYCIALRDSLPQAIIKNNIFNNATYGIRVESGATNPIENYNDYFNLSIHNYYNADTLSDIALGANSIISNPLLTSSYKLTNTSPCKDTGVNLTTVTDDYEGNPRPLGASTDMGAYEWYKCKIRNATLKGCQI